MATTNNSSDIPSVSGTLVEGTGTGFTTIGYSTTPTASTISEWDANKNMSANSFVAGYTTTATAAGTTVLTVGSTQQQYFTGSTTQTVTMPVTSTLVLGQNYTIVNNSTGVVTVQSSGGNTIQSMAAGTTLVLTVILTSGTTAASWSGAYISNTIPTGGITWTDVTGTSQTAVANNGYTTNNAGLVTVTLPSSAAYGTTIAIVGKGAGGWKIAQLTGQTIHYGIVNTTSGTGGSLASTLQYDVVYLLCTIANTDYTVVQSIGNITVV